MSDLHTEMEALRLELATANARAAQADAGWAHMEALFLALPVGLLLLDIETQETLFANPKAQKLLDTGFPACDTCDHPDYFMRMLSGYTGGDGPHAWDLSCEPAGLYYRITSCPFAWKGKAAYAHIIEDISQQIAHTSALAKQAYRDELTHLYNRRYCLEQLGDCLMADGFFSLAYFDIDNLKYVNDVFGHAEGDAYIMLICETVSKSIRGVDVFGRMGGDEFLVIFHNTPSIIVENKFAAIRRTIMAYSHVVKPYDACISYGVIETPPGRSDMTPGALLEVVDERMYQFKRENKPAPGYRGDTSPL